MLLVGYGTLETINDMGILSMEPERTWQPLLATAANEGQPTVSPNGEWIAYNSLETGENEVYIARFQTLEDRQPVSLGGGGEPLFSPEGGELFYQAGDGLMKVTVTTDPDLQLGTPERVFDNGPYISGLARAYDVTPDGQRFLMVKEGALEADASAPRINVVLNWFEELKERVPVP